MLEDKLEHNERIRLECLAQANARVAPNMSADKIVDMAKTFETFVKGE